MPLLKVYRISARYCFVKSDVSVVITACPISEPMLPRTHPNAILFHCTYCRGAMGTLMPVAEGEKVPSGMNAVHGVVHRLWPADFATLTNMEHEYR